MIDREKVIKGLECCVKNMGECELCQYDEGRGKCGCGKQLYADALALLKAQEPVKPILARGWYWCGSVGCRYSLTSALDDDSPARKPNYCEKCGRAVKWE